MSIRSAILFFALFLTGAMATGSSVYFYLNLINAEEVGDSVMSETPTQAVQEAEEIIYTDHGFEPSTTSVQIGSRVIFLNDTDTPLWVASDPHPLHSDYSEFDARRSIAKGESYEYVFTKSGTFGFHNHERSIDRGFIYVKDPVTASQNIDKTKEELRGVRDSLLALLKPEDSRSIFTVIDTIQADETFSLNCHDIAHDIGHRAYEYYGFSVAMTFSDPEHLKHPLAEFICAGGYMHGITEELLLHQPSYKFEPDRICEGVGEDDLPSCYHGVGHAFMLSEARLSSLALNDCRNTSELRNRYRCFEGVWMEFFWGASEDGSLGWEKDDPQAICVASIAEERPTCFLYATFGYLRFHPKDYAGAVTMCTEKGLNESDNGFCLKGLGMTMMSKFHGHHLEGSEIYATNLSEKQKRSFYEGVLGYADLSGLGKAELENSCKLLKTDTALCLSVLEVIKK